ncbi:MAG: NTPase [Chloroflexi bacterium]|nr:NTPase [Chloroflexota bacterium]
MITACLVTGAPGSGKTTLLRDVAAAFKGRAGGFYTEEMRSKGTREGFSLVTLDSERVTLSHVDLPGRPRVGKYGVDVTALERVGVAAVREAVRRDDLIVIDEIGKMELFSPAFREVVLEALNSGKRVLGTIMMAPHPFADGVKRLPQVRVIVLAKDNRQQVKADVLHWLETPERT